MSEGADVIDVGQVGSEMLYFLVGSRELDGGLMCTASHNPKAYTGAKLVREGAIALSGDSGIQDIRRMIEADLRPARRVGGSASEARAGSLRSSTSTRSSRRRRCASSTRGRPLLGERPLKVVVDGGNGMAGPMVGPLLEQLGLDLIETYWTPDGNFPDHEPNPLLPENRRLHHRPGARRAAPTSASPGTATPTAASSSTTPAPSSTATSSRRCWPSRCSKKQPGRGDPL